MNAIQYSLNFIKRHIPHEVLEAAMMIDENPQTAYLTSLDEKIMNKVIRKNVLLDANIVGGIEMFVNLAMAQLQASDQQYTVFFINKELTMNRDIVSVLGLTTNNAFQNNSGMIGTSSNPITSVTNRIMTSLDPSGILHNAVVELVGPNTVMIDRHYSVVGQFSLRCLVENENNLNNISTRSYNDFGMLVLLAVKMYIYNKLIIAIDSGYLAGGQDLGMFKSIVESYDSAWEDYDVFLREKWSKIAWMNDTPRYNRYLNSMLSPDI